VEIALARAHEGLIRSTVVLLPGKMTVSVEGVGELASPASGDFIREMLLVASAAPSATVTPKTGSSECRTYSECSRTICAGRCSLLGSALRVQRRLAGSDRLQVGLAEGSGPLRDVSCGHFWI